MSRFMNPRLAGLTAYTPGEQPQDRAYIKLNTNESPYPPSKGVHKIMRGEVIDNLRLYCNPDCTALKKELACIYGANPAQIFVSNGSDDILNFAFWHLAQVELFFRTFLTDFTRFLPICTACPLKPHL